MALKTPNEPVRMRKEIGLVSASAIMTGIIIGSGIFVSPVSFTKNCGSVGMSLTMWIVSAILTLLVALCFNELGSIYPKSGGEYTFLKEAVGPLPAFVDAWQHFAMIQPSFQALLGLTTADYIVQTALPENCHVPDIAIKLATICIIVVVVVLNSVYVRYVTRIQTVLSSIKVLTLCVIVVTGIVQLAKGRTEHLSRGFEGTNTDISAYAVAVHSGIFTYMGWQYVFCLMEEVKNPSRTVPLATFISVAVVTVLYTLTNVAYFTVMSPEEMIQSRAVAVTFAERTLGKFSVIVPLLVACSTIGSLNGAILGGSRYYYAAARDGLFPSVLATVHVKYLTPWPALFSVTVLTTIYVLMGETVALVEFTGFGMTILMTVAIACLLYLRWRKPDIERPIKVPLCVPVGCFVLLLCLVVLGIVQTPYQNGIAAILVACGIPLYYLGNKLAPKSKFWREKSRRYACIVQKIMKTVPTAAD